MNTNQLAIFPDVYTEVYSVAIDLNDFICSEVGVLKHELAAKIGWYPSRNSRAHITINNFETDTNSLQVLENFILDFCKTVSPFEIVLE